jgi:hypothetical protein
VLWARSRQPDPSRLRGGSRPPMVQPAGAARAGDRGGWLTECGRPPIHAGPPAVIAAYRRSAEAAGREPGEIILQGLASSAPDDESGTRSVMRMEGNARRGELHRARIRRCRHEHLGSRSARDTAHLREARAPHPPGSLRARGGQRLKSALVAPIGGPNPGSDGNCNPRNPARCVAVVLRGADRRAGHRRGDCRGRRGRSRRPDRR